MNLEIKCLFYLLLFSLLTCNIIFEIKIIALSKFNCDTNLAMIQMCYDNPAMIRMRYDNVAMIRTRYDKVAMVRIRYDNSAMIRIRAHFINSKLSLL